MIEVIYYSLTGNTKKVADAIAAELGVDAENVKTKDMLAEDSLVFLGAGLYGPLRGLGSGGSSTETTLPEGRWLSSAPQEKAGARKLEPWRKR